MSKISIKLNEDYKSFKKDFERELEGDLIVLTGVNGSGKSQLLEMLFGDYTIKPYSDGQKVPISSVIKQNGVEISKGDIFFKSFQQVISLKPISKESSFNIKNIEASVLQELLKDKKQKKRYKKQLKINKGKINEEEIKELKDKIHEMFVDKLIRTSPEAFNLSNESSLADFFDAQNLSDIFLFHGISIPENPKPWTILNQLFSKFNFDYKFADNYTISNGNIKESVELLDKNNQPLPFETESLSDGEKTIFSLAIASMKAEINEVLPKILLLDEYDATFNPSLTEVFYYILEEFFVKKGVTVILTTHNPATVAFAPKIEGYETTFYEINKPNSGKDRIEPKKWEEIEEVKMVLRKFYPQVGGYEKEIEGLKKQNLPILFVEGKTDKIILENAWEKLYLNEKMPVSIRDGRGCDSMKALIRQRESLNPLKIFWIFDYDDEGFKVQNESFHCGKKDSQFKILENVPLDIKKDISNEFYLMLLPLVKFDNKNYASFSSKNKHQTIEHLFEKKLWGKLGEEKEVVPDHSFWYMPKRQKTKFAESTAKFSANDFKNFMPIFETIEEVLRTEKNG
jgi:ABC-type uncharacterized transport system ATPase component